MAGKLIAITGIDGAGKTTQSSNLVEYLNIIRPGSSIKLSASDVVRATFPDDESIFKRISEMEDGSISLFWASIYRQFAFEVKKLVDSGYVVVVDRWDESFLSYNLNFGAISKYRELVTNLNQFAFGSIIPDITFLLDIEPIISIERLTIRDGNSDESLEQLESDRMFYLQMAAERGWTVINAQLKPEYILRELLTPLNLPINYDFLGKLK